LSICVFCSLKRRCISSRSNFESGFIAPLLRAKRVCGGGDGGGGGDWRDKTESDLSRAGELCESKLNCLRPDCSNPKRLQEIDEIRQKLRKREEGIDGYLIPNVSRI
jgi:hypothetical protein